MTPLKTPRLLLRELDDRDAPFILKLVNEPSFIENIGDRGVRDEAGAIGYIRRIQDSYLKNGFGLWAVERQADSVALGVCGLVKRAGLDHPDIGFAFLPDHWRQGYAHESAAEVIRWARDSLRLPRLYGITALENEPSTRLLEKLGLQFIRIIQLADIPEESRFFEIAFSE